MSVNSSQFFQSAAKFGFTWLLIRGILGVLLGLILLFAPAAGTAGVAIFVGITIGLWLLFDGAATIARGWSKHQASVQGAGWVMVGGVLEIIVGILALAFSPSVGVATGIVILYFLAFGMIAGGIAELGSRLGGAGSIIFGILNIIFGIILFATVLANPGGSLLAFAWVGGLYGVIFGIAGIVMAFQVRGAGKQASRNLG